MIEIPDTTLICTDCRDVTHAIKVLERCKALCSFPAIKLLTSSPTDYEHKVEIPHIGSLIHYSIFMLKEIHKYIDTKYFLVVQRDGWILNPQSWNNDWFGYDYIGALFNQYDTMGVGGFSFRSKAIMERVSKEYREWNNTEEDAQRLQQEVIGFYEDGAIAIKLRPKLEKEGFKFPSLEVAAKFSQGGNPNPKYHVDYPFSYHGSWKTIDLETGRVHPQIKHDGILPVL